MKFQAVNKVKYISVVLLLSLCSFFFGSYIGKHGIPTQSNSLVAPARVLNKFIDPIPQIIGENEVQIREFKNFNGEISEYLRTKRQVHPNISVGYYFRDLNTGLWFGQNENQKFSPASLFKLPILMAFLKRAETDSSIFQTGLKYDQKEIFEVEEESGFPKEKGKFYTLEELLAHMICYSDNAATLVLMQFLGDSSILKVYNDLNIQIRNDFNQNTDFISVKEYSAILRVLYHATYLNEAMSEKALTLLTQSKYTKGIRQAIPANLVIAHKYGNRIDESKGNKKSELHHFGIVYEKNRPFIIGVMTKGGTLEEREKIVSDLAKITYEQVKAKVNNTENAISVFKE